MPPRVAAIRLRARKEGRKGIGLGPWVVESFRDNEWKGAIAGLDHEDVKKLKAKLAAKGSMLEIVEGGLEG